MSFPKSRAWDKVFHVCLSTHRKWERSKEKKTGEQGKALLEGVIKLVSWGQLVLHLWASLETSGNVSQDSSPDRRQGEAFMPQLLSPISEGRPLGVNSPTFLGPAYPHLHGTSRRSQKPQSEGYLAWI